MLFVLLAACMGERTSELPAGPEACLQDRSAVSAEDATLGFSAADVIALMQSSPPAGMSWDYAIFDVGTQVEVSALGQDGEASLVSVPEGEDCEAFPAELLAVPVQLTVSLAGGELSATFTEEVFAEAATPGGVHLWDSETGQSWDMSVGAELDAEIGAWLSSEHGVSSAPELILWFGGGSSTWADGELAAEILVDEQALRAWDGAWSL